MAKGTESKNIIFNKLKEIYSNSFWEDEGKILRIPLTENGETIEIKVTLTAAKNNLGTAGPASAFSESGSEEVAGYMPSPTSSATVEMTQEEKDNVANLLASLGL